jgi:hypothetical protein
MSDMERLPGGAGEDRLLRCAALRTFRSSWGPGALLAAALAGLVLEAGCRKGAGEADAGAQLDVASGKPPTVTLFSDEEAAALEAELARELEANRTRECRRPVLGGESLPGRADEDVIAVIEGSAGGPDCARIIEERFELVADATGTFWEEEPPADRPHVRPVRGSFPEETGALDETLRALRPACDGLPAAFSRAVRHADACSPYLPGRLRAPRWPQVVRLVRGAMVLARGMIAEGRFAEAARFVLDVLLLQQDLRRGGVDTVAATCSALLARSAARALDLLLNSPTPLPPGLAESIERELASLQASEPPPPVFIVGEHLNFVQLDVLPRLKGPGYQPQGGWPMGVEPPAAPGASDASAGPAADPAKEAENRQALRLAWIVSRQLRDDWHAACPDGTRWQACLDAIAALGDALEAELKRLRAEAVAAVAGRRPDGAADISRRTLVLVGEVVASAQQERYLEQLTFAPYLLGTLRLHAGFRAIADRTGTCPSPAAFDGEPLRSLRADPLGGPPLFVYAGKRPGVVIAGREQPLWRVDLESEDGPRDQLDAGFAPVLLCPGTGPVPPEPSAADAGVAADVGHRAD